MSGQISLHARFNAQEGKGQELAAILQELIDIVQREEGAKFYSLNRGREDQSDVVWFYEIYEDMAAMDAHGKYPEFGAVFAKAREVMDGAPELIRSDVVGVFSRLQAVSAREARRRPDESKPRDAPCTQSDPRRVDDRSPPSAERTS